MGFFSTVWVGLTGFFSCLSSGLDVLKKLEDRQERKRKKEREQAEMALKNDWLTILKYYVDRYRAMGTRFDNGDGRSKAQLHLGILDSAEIMIRDFPSVHFRNGRETQTERRMLHAVSIRTGLLSP